MGFASNGLNVETEVCVKVAGCGKVVRRYFPSPWRGKSALGYHGGAFGGFRFTLCTCWGVVRVFASNVFFL